MYHSSYYCDFSGSIHVSKKLGGIKEIMKNIMEKIKTFMLLFVVILISGLVGGLMTGRSVSDIPTGIVVLSPVALLSALACTRMVYNNSEHRDK